MFSLNNLNVQKTNKGKDKYFWCNRKDECPLSSNVNFYDLGSLPWHGIVSCHFFLGHV